jgi:hypothetical protein
VLNIICSLRSGVMSNTIGIIIVISFMAFCLHGVYKIIKDKESNNGN